MAQFLLVNDDGYQAAGIWHMQAALVEAGYEVVMVAPKHQQSWSGKSLFDYSPVTHEILKIKDQTVHVIDGTPAACARIALHNILETPPLFVVSGINHGGNDGIHFMMSSGTLGAAVEASFDGVRSLAVSLARAPSYQPDAENIDQAFKQAASIARDLVRRLEHYTFPADIDVLNLNVPYQITDSKIAVCKHDKSSYGQLYQKNTGANHYEKIYYSNRLEEYEKIKPLSNTDTDYLRQGRPALTPISLDLASNDAIEALSDQLPSR